MTTDWTSIVELAATLLALLVAWGGSSALINRIKNFYGLEGQGALILTWAVNLATGVLTAVASGALYPELLSDPARVLTILIISIAGSRIGSEQAYQYTSYNSDD